MSQLLGHALPEFRLAANNQSLVGQPWRQECDHDVAADRPKSFATPWWPGSGFLGDLAADIAVLKSWFFEPPEITSGANSRLGYQGVTRDANNSPLGGATVKCFRTADDSKVTPDIVSDPLSGEFVISTPYYEAHWLKIEKAGTPHVQGVSVNNIFPNV